MAAAAAARRYFIQCIVERWECLSPLRGSKRREGYLDYELIESAEQTGMRFFKMCLGKGKDKIKFRCQYQRGGSRRGSMRSCGLLSSSPCFMGAAPRQFPTNPSVPANELCTEYAAFMQEVILSVLLHAQTESRPTTSKRGVGGIRRR